MLLSLIHSILQDQIDFSIFQVLTWTRKNECPDGSFLLTDWYIFMRLSPAERSLSALELLINLVYICCCTWMLPGPLSWLVLQTYGVLILAKFCIIIGCIMPVGGPVMYMDRECAIWYNKKAHLPLITTTRTMYLLPSPRSHWVTNACVCVKRVQLLLTQCMCWGDDTKWQVQTLWCFMMMNHKIWPSKNNIEEGENACDNMSPIFLLYHNYIRCL